MATIYPVSIIPAAVADDGGVDKVGRGVVGLLREPAVEDVVRVVGEVEELLGYL